ncbi:MAG TPA: PVC-type heme-binding CxxCH protein [Vicinamibacterales bacterium]|nr:PVC-type heme-binding CxxCH protein [Vicinamibacterales bacterium]
MRRLAGESLVERMMRGSLARIGIVAVALVVLVVAAAWPIRGDVHAQQPSPSSAAADAGRPLHVLFLGQDETRPHAPANMFGVVDARLARRGIQLIYAATPADALAPETLRYYDALVIYGDERTLTADEERTLVDFVQSGHGLIAIHSAATMFPESTVYTSLLGGRFQPGSVGAIAVDIADASHPVVQGVQPFTTEDEAETLTDVNATNRTVLMTRDGQPWTWVRTEGQGRVFVTAYGHDERTWQQPAFQQLIQQAIVWTVNDDARQAFAKLQMPDVTYVDGFDVPNYERRDPAPKYQMPFSPADEQKFLITRADMRIELFASEPDVIKPIAMAFDERGRLWVIEAMDYPNDVFNGQPGDDRIKILEDTNGDGRADKFTVFADHLNLATSLVFANGGVIVSAAPNFLFLQDTNGDDKADVRRVLYTGWGLRDTHAGPSNLQYGPDNHIWGVVGYSGFQGEIDGKPMQFAQAAYRFKPDGSDFDVVTGTTNNTWGLGFNETFDVFGSTANGDPSWYAGIPNRYFDGIEGLPPAAGRGVGLGYQSLADFTTVHPTTPYIRQVDNQGFYTAGAGHMFYTARAFPKAYWNRIAFINEPTAHIIGQGIVEPKGAGYVTRDGWNLVSSAEEWFAPVVATVGPDGAVWVADWYNFIVQHNPTPEGFSAGRGAAYETSMRDHLRGRIYRVVYKDAPAQPKRSLSKSDPAGLVDALGSDNMFWRLQAQRLLVERANLDVVPQLVAIVQNRAVDAIGTNGGALHALWTLKGLGAIDAASGDGYRAAVGALRHPAAGVRKAAAIVLPHTADAANAMLSANLLQDPDLHTRLAAVLVMADMPDAPNVADALYRASHVAENYTDPWLGRALYIAATRHRDTFLARYRADRTALPFAALSVPLRLGDLRPDWRTPAARDLAADWKDMPVPGAWETHGLADFDGAVWFTRTFDVAPGATVDSLSLGPVRNTADVWLNGLELMPTRGPSIGANGRPQPPAIPGLPPSPTSTARYTTVRYPVPAGAAHAGSNTLTVRITNTRGDGGFVGTDDDLYVEAGSTRMPLAGTWKYRIERSSNTGALYTSAGELAAHVAFTAAGGIGSAAAAALPSVAAAPDVVLQLGVVPNEMKFSTTALTVQAGQLVEIAYTNADQVQHNFVLGVPGSLQQIGAAADAYARDPGAAGQAYVPDAPQIIFKTNLVSAGDTVRFQFRAPSDPGDYPFLCTFPGHWRMMNGVLTVTPAFGRGRGAVRGARAGGRGAQGR